MDLLYLTIWLALLLFSVGETGRIVARGRQPAPAWAWWAFSTGLLLAVVHTLLAFAIVHDWAHEEAVRRTAEQTEAVFGVAVGWGVYVNYAFLGAWLLDAWWWRARPYARSAAITWGLRAFYMTMVFNGAVVFASGARRLLGLLIVAWLSCIWIAAVAISSPSVQRR